MHLNLQDTEALASIMSLIKEIDHEKKKRYLLVQFLLITYGADEDTAQYNNRKPQIAHCPGQIKIK